MRLQVRRFAAAILCLAFLALFLSGCSPFAKTGSSGPTLLGPCPVPTPGLLANPWVPTGSGTFINTDGDPDLECLVTYRYNVTNSTQGPIGGVVFDPQQAPDQAANLVSYQLLPRVARQYFITQTVPGSLPGVLGALGEQTAQGRMYDINGDGKGDELGMIGIDAAGRQTTLSLYRWRSPLDGYVLLGYFHGNNRVEIATTPPVTNPAVYSGTVTSVQTVDSFYDRSGLANFSLFERQPDGSGYAFRTNVINFLNGKPASTCYYPEGQTLVNLQNAKHPYVFDLRVWSEEGNRATVCAGYWDIYPGEFRRIVALVDLVRQPGATGACDVWREERQRILSGKTNCEPVAPLR
jgi:hypothetical protein